MHEEVYYTAGGVVLGECWTGERVYYQARAYCESRLSDIRREIREDFKTGALDSGMGYRGLIGALMIITKYTMIKYKGREFINATSKRMYLGEIDRDEAMNVIVSE
jgi:hypothetical protein